MTMQSPQNILVIRNDKLGDFMLAWPSFQFVKQLFPNSITYALVPKYTCPMAELCPWIDEIVLDDNRDGISGITNTTAKIKKLNIDAALCLHSTPRIAVALFLAGVPHRFAPASRIDQFLYNHTLTQRRSRSEKPEYEYNTDLVLFMGQHYGINSTYTLNPPLLSFSEVETRNIKNWFYTENSIDKNKSLVFIHAGSGGSASNLSIDQYAELIKLLSNNISLFFVLTAGPGEEAIVKELSRKIKNCPHIIYQSDKGLIEFSKLLSIANIFISGSTGTLHLAGSMDIPTTAFYPLKKSATSLRWKTINTETKQLVFTLDDMKESGNSEINIKQVSQEIIENYFSIKH